MIQIVISGCNGHMGRVVEEICAADAQVNVAAGFDVLGTGERAFPVYSAPEQYGGAADVVIDFSHPSALTGLLRFCKARRAAAVLATTGYSQEQLKEIDRAAEEIPIFRSANMSLGVNVLLELIKKAAPILEGFDIEIVERHHNRKVDAPSGTALMLADAAASAVPYKAEYVYQRSNVRQPRGAGEIGISSVRGGTIVGDHEVIFCGRDEVIELHHHAASREIFATGAVKAAKFLVGKANGLYSMADLVSQAAGPEE
ncbi:MAG: 4-hydroxy-tetrahydrodipicolinate reductase [Oscillospiraceae bacterium]|nr:4-hydroxy-tetrahydrodipicolinate reductase [Oscillospiraceae bacterium]MCD8376494.1 4-hydroxy-tetrahydrodipicolinate reductase [Oscillospiraceae bacterium]